MIAGKTLSGIISACPEAAGVLNRYDIDFREYPDLKLSEVCRGNAMKLFEIVRDLHLLEKQSMSKKSKAEFSEMGLKELCDYIVNRHHAFVNSTLPALVVHGFQVAAEYGQRYKFLEEVKKHLTLIRVEFIHHMMKEEEILFPRIAELEKAFIHGVLPGINLKMIVDPLKVILKDHTHSETWFAEIRKLTDDFTCPVDADNLFRLFYKELEAFESDLHDHVYLENEMLFPRVKQLVLKTGY